MDLTEQQRIARAVLVWLKDVSTTMPEERRESLDVACQCLHEAFDPLPESELPLPSLVELFKSADKASKPSAPAAPFAAFSAFIDNLTSRNYFEKLSSDDPEYALRFERARKKFMSKFPTSGCPPAAAELPKLAEDEKNKGNQLLAEKKYNEAVVSYTKAIEMFPKAIYYGNRAAAHSFLGEHQKALDDSQEAIKLDPKYTKGYGRMAASYAFLGNWSQAAQCYEQALQLDPHNTTYLQGLADAEDKLEAASSNSQRHQHVHGPGCSHGHGHGHGHGQSPNSSGSSSQPTNQQWSFDGSAGGFDLNSLSSMFQNRDLLNNMMQSMGGSMNTSEFQNIANSFANNFNTNTDVTSSTEETAAASTEGTTVMDSEEMESDATGLPPNMMDEIQRMMGNPELMSSMLGAFGNILNPGANAGSNQQSDQPPSTSTFGHDISSDQPE
eukprot:GILK01003394.1.p1 GENE.GILK01003394.1~~GILK01003394.1.p1  ORF type:complete len:441 (-),score=97.34 GILK01003394.1:177-1499(-)